MASGLDEKTTNTSDLLEEIAALRKHVAELEAEKANLAKSRFLAAANHDLRQPLQAMSLLLGALSYAGLDDDGKEVA